MSEEEEERREIEAQVTGHEVWSEPIMGVEVLREEGWGEGRGVEEGEGKMGETGKGSQGRRGEGRSREGVGGA